MKKIGHLINGKEEFENHSNIQPIYNPATGNIVAEVEIASDTFISHTVELAKQAFETWSLIPPRKRAEILSHYKLSIEKNITTIAKLITNEHGKTLEESKGSILRGLEVVELATQITELLKGDYSQTVAKGIACYSIKQPLGVCAGITPFNFPAMIPLWMFPVAIACGNTFILKPSPRNPSTAIHLVKLLYACGLPENVVQVINGDKATVDSLLKHPDIVAISSVSSTPVAKYIYQNGTKYGKRVQAFGGAKNHAVIMPDAPLASVATQLVEAAFGNTGQRCMAISVAVVVGNNTANQLIAKIAEKAKLLRIGDGHDPHINMAALNNPELLARVTQSIQTGIEEGATLILDGRRYTQSNDSKGFFIGPTIFDNVHPNMHIYQDEIFGPVLCIVRVDTLEAAIKLINEQSFANGTAIFTDSGSNADKFAREIQVGMVGVNISIPVPVAYHVFGGWKNSFFGDTSMHGHEGARFYTKTKTVTTRWDTNNT